MQVILPGREHGRGVVGEGLADVVDDGLGAFVGVAGRAVVALWSGFHKGLEGFFIAAGKGEKMGEYLPEMRAGNLGNSGQSDGIHHLVPAPGIEGVTWLDMAQRGLVLVGFLGLHQELGDFGF